jgi:ribosome maturation factor RimP
MTEEREVIIDRVRELAEPLITDAEMELVDVEFVGGHGNYILRVLIEKPSRVTLDDCVVINRELSELLDIEDPIPYRYTLEVSSPGMDRPFKTVRDYERAYGKLVKLTTRAPVDGTNVHVGRLEKCEDGAVTIMIDDTMRHIPLEMIQKARRELVW